MTARHVPRLPTRLRLAGPVAVAAGSVSASSQVLLLATSAYLISRAAGRPPVLLLAVAIGGVQALALARGLSRYGERLAVHDRALARLGDLRLWLFDRLAGLVPGGLGRSTTGSVLGAFVTDTDTVVETAARATIAGVEAAAGSVCAVGLLAALAWPAAVVLAGGAVAGAGVAAATRAASRTDSARVAQATADLVEVTLAGLAAAPELAAYGRRDLVDGAVASAGQRAEAADRHRSRRVALGRAAGLVVVGATLLGVLAVGLAAHRAGHLDGVALAVAALASLAALETIAVLPAVAAGLAGGASAGQRLAALATSVPPAPEPDRADPPPSRPAGIALEQAVVERDGRVVLDGLSLAVPPGRRLGLAGASGSGKTTAVLTLLHFLECSSGRARLGGVPVDRLARHVLAARVGWVPEDTHLFCGTLRANLRVAAPEADDDACRRALDRVGLTPLLASLADGLDTAVGATGRPLSSGERQRIGLARALLADTDVVLLDEPTAHLDPDGATATLAELVAASRGRALLVVAHDADLLVTLDATVHLDRGRGRGT